MGRSGFFAVLVCALSFSSLVVADITIEDDFEDDFINPAVWTLTEVGSATTLEAGGTLRVGGPTNATAFSIMTMNTELVGDFDVWIDYEWFSYDGSGDARAQLSIWNTSETEEFEMNVHRWTNSAREIVFGKTSGLIGVTFSVPLTGGIRISRVGNTFQGYYWNGGGWISLGQSSGFTGDAVISFEGNNPSNNFGNGAYQIDFDNFHAEGQNANVAMGVPATKNLGLGVLCLFLALGGVVYLLRSREFALE